MNIMNIDIERLKVDAGYWDEVAPEGATHYDPEDMGAPWMMELESNWMFYWESKTEWVGYLQKAMLARIVARLVIRPDAQEEWTGTGRPPVGTECEAEDAEHGWILAIVIAHDDAEGVAVCKTFYGYDGYSNFRPIRTQAQTDRTQLLTALNQLRGETDMGIVADVILSIGFRLER